MHCNTDPSATPLPKNLKNFALCKILTTININPLAIPSLTNPSRDIQLKTLLPLLAPSSIVIGAVVETLYIVHVKVGGTICCCAGGEDKPAEPERIEKKEEEKQASELNKRK